MVHHSAFYFGLSDLDSSIGMKLASACAPSKCCGVHVRGVWSLMLKKQSNLASQDSASHTHAD